MTIAIGIAVALAVVAFLGWRMVSPSLDKVVDRAVGAKDLAPLIAEIEKKPESAQPTAYNHAIKRLWDGYQREMAVELLRSLAMGFGTTRITQFWLKQVQQVEPALARDRLGKEFLETYYMPELAAQCGPVG